MDLEDLAELLEFVRQADYPTIISTCKSSPITFELCRDNIDLSAIIQRKREDFIREFSSLTYPQMVKLCKGKMGAEVCKIKAVKDIYESKKEDFNMRRRKRQEGREPGAIRKSYDQGWQPRDEAMRLLKHPYEAQWEQMRQMKMGPDREAETLLENYYGRLPQRGAE